MRDDYRDMLDMARHVSKRHKMMAREARAAQFYGFDLQSRTVPSGGRTAFETSNTRK